MGGRRILQETDRKFSVSPSTREMECELRQWTGIGKQWRMKIKGIEHTTAIERGGRGRKRRHR